MKADYERQFADEFRKIAEYIEINTSNPAKAIIPFDSVFF